MLLKNALIYDGSGEQPFRGDISFDEGGIKAVGAGLPAEDRQIDCGGLAAAPGFIDFHSHNDWFIGASDRPGFMLPFLEQGITTHIGGNCGFGPAGYMPNSPHLNLLQSNLFKEGVSDGISWASFEEYFNHLGSRGLRGNIAALAGSGTTRASISGYDAADLNGDDLGQYLALLDDAMRQGALGVSFGMGYAPDIFAGRKQILEVMKLVKKHDKLVTVHLRAQSLVSGVYPMKPFGTPHNIISIKEFLDLAEDTGVKLNISHMIFVGRRSWRTYEPLIRLFDEYRARGCDLSFDTYSHHCGATVVTGILPDWFMAEVPAAYRDARLRLKVRVLMSIAFKTIGFDFRDMQLASACCGELEEYNGMFLSDMAKARGVSNFDNYMDIAEKSGSSARMLLHGYSNPQIIAGLMRHPDSHFMTDSWVEPDGLQNPAVYGAFPKFLQRSASEGVIPLELAVRKLSGANADRAGLAGRGYLRPGMGSDIVVFDPRSVADREGGRPSGIEHVFLNGVYAVRGGTADEGCRSGRVLLG